MLHVGLMAVNVCVAFIYGKGQKYVNFICLFLVICGLYSFYSGGACEFSMEMLVGFEDNEEGRLEDNGVDRSSSALSSPKKITNPLVYKLVRVY